MPEAERLSKNEQLAEKRSFEGNCEIVRTFFQQRVLSSNIPAKSICALNFGNFMHELEMRWERFNEMPAKRANPKRPLEP